MKRIKIMQYRKWKVVSAVVVTVVSLPLLAQTIVGTVRVENIWARATAGEARNGAVFMTITDFSGHGDTLVAATSPVSLTTELHLHQVVDGVVQMRSVVSIPIPADSSITLQPGAAHVMLLGLKKPLQEGSTIAVTLIFAKAGRVETIATIRGIGAMSSVMDKTDSANTYKVNMN